MQALWQWWGAQASPKKKKKKKESGGSRESAELQERRRPKGRERTGVKKLLADSLDRVSNQDVRLEMSFHHT